MASPTAIPHPETSSHHQAHAGSSSSPPRPGLVVPNRNSPPLLSPIYARTAFSLPGGPVSPSNSFRNTASGWTTAGVKGPGVIGAVASQQTAQKDYFPERHHGGSHHRTSSTSSTTSSTDSVGPTTPRTGEPPSTSLSGGAPLGRVRSIPLASSYEAIKSQKEGWNGSQGWAGLSSFRSQGNTAVNVANVNPSTSPPTSGGMGNLFRRLSMSGNPVPVPPPPTRRETTHGQPNRHHHHPHRSASMSSHGVSAPAASLTRESPATAIKETTELVGGGSIPVPAASATAAVSPNGQKTRGRRAESGGSIKRKPSPHGERLLMGWTHAH